MIHRPSPESLRPSSALTLAHSFGVNSNKTFSLLYYVSLPFILCFWGQEPRRTNSIHNMLPAPQASRDPFRLPLPKPAQHDCSSVSIRAGWRNRHSVEFPASQNPVTHCIPNSHPPRGLRAGALLCAESLLGISQSLFPIASSNWASV